MKLDLTDVIAVLQDLQVETTKINQARKELTELAEASKDEQESGPPVKYQPIIICTDPTVNLSNAPLFVLEHQDTMNHQEAQEALIGAVREHNTTAKKKRVIGSIGRAFLYLSGKNLKAAGLKIKYREAVIAVTAPNAIEGVQDAEAGAEA